MDDRLHQQLLEDTQALRELLGRCSSETIVGFVAALFLKWPDEDIGLTSPHKQLFFLLGLMLSTSEPSEPKEFDKEQWRIAQDLLERIVLSYAWMYWPTPEEAGRVGDEWFKTREIAMPAFLHFFTSGLLASTEQLKDRIRRYLVPLDEQVKTLLHVSASEMLDVTAAIAKFVQGGYDSLREVIRDEKAARHALLDRATAEHWDRDKLRIEAHSAPHRDTADKLMAALMRLSKIDQNELSRAVDPNTVRLFWNLFAIRRGQGSTYTYITESNPAEERPVFVHNDVGYVPSVYTIYAAVLNVTERTLLQSEHGDAFLRRRDKELEYEAEALFRILFGDSATILTSVYETPDFQYEHDIVIHWGRRLFVVEAKASPPKEPFRDPDKAYLRIKRAFNSDRGLQKAYDQARRIERSIGNHNAMTLYDAHGCTALQIDGTSVDRTYCICLTRDNFGLLATDLSLLLEKDTDGPYPWAANIVDLYSLFDAWEYFGWGPERFCEYLEGREKMHGRVFSHDEMGFAGYLIAHGDFDSLFRQDFDSLTLNPSYTEVFNQIHRAKLGGAHVRYDPHPPVLTDLSSEMSKWRAKSVTINKTADKKPRTHKQGRNELCACGSGKKYKRCCGA